MNKNKRNSKTKLNSETVKVLSSSDMGDVVGGGMCSTAAPTGMCCTQSKTCTHTN